MDTQQNNRLTVLVTGGAGFVGSNLCRILLEKGCIVYAVDNLITGYEQNITPLKKYERFYFLNLDITSSLFLDTFENISLDEIYHLACPTGVPNIKILAEEMLITCSLGTKSALELARIHSAKFLLASSCEVYGQPEIFPQYESYTGNVDPIGPRSPYEEGKRFSESLVSMYVKKYGVEAKIVRIFNTYGPGMSLQDQRVIPQFLQSIATGTDFRIYGNGEQTRVHLYIDDLITGLLLVIRQGNPGDAYNVGGNKQTSIKQLAKLIIELTGSKNNISFQPHFIEDHQHRLPALTKIESLGWKQTVSLEEGLPRMIKSLNLTPASISILRQPVPNIFQDSQQLSSLWLRAHL